MVTCGPGRKQCRLSSVDLEGQERLQDCSGRRRKIGADAATEKPRISQWRLSARSIRAPTTIDPAISDRAGTRHGSSHLLPISVTGCRDDKESCTLNPNVEIGISRKTPWIGYGAALACPVGNAFASWSEAYPNRVPITIETMSKTSE
jgi:hypothetical protein